MKNINKGKSRDAAVIMSDKPGDKTYSASFIAAMGQHRFWEREEKP